MEKDYASPISSKIPTLITTGERDPVTPPLYGDRIAKNLPNSLHVIIPSGGHGFNGLDGLDCVTDLITEFIRTASVKGLDTSCVRSIRRQGFMLTLPDDSK